MHWKKAYFITCNFSACLNFCVETDQISFILKLYTSDKKHSPVWHACEVLGWFTIVGICLFKTYRFFLSLKWPNSPVAITSASCNFKWGEDFRDFKKRKVLGKEAPGSCWDRPSLCSWLQPAGRRVKPQSPYSSRYSGLSARQCPSVYHLLFSYHYSFVGKLGNTWV